LKLKLRMYALNVKGFTLIELMIVVLILGILASVSVGYLNNHRARARCGDAELAAHDLLLGAEKARSERGVNLATATVTFAASRDHEIQMAVAPVNSGVRVSLPDNVQLTYTQTNPRTITVTATRQLPACPMGDGTYQIQSGQRQGVW